MMTKDQETALFGPEDHEAPISKGKGFRFNEDALRADIVKVWGEYGAHTDLFDMMRKQSHPARIELSEMLDALKAVVGDESNTAYPLGIKPWLVIDTILKVEAAIRKAEGR